MNNRERIYELFKDTKHSTFEHSKIHGGMFAIAYAIQDLAEAIREVNKPSECPLCGEDEI